MENEAIGATMRPDDPNAPTSRPVSSAPAPIYSKINDLYKQHLGRDGRPEELSQWGTDIDPTYMGKISNAIYGSAEGAAYRQKQASQQNTADTAQTQTATPPPAQPASPVTSTGAIAPPAPAAPPPPAAQTLTAPTLPTTPPPTYTPGQISQFQAPNQSGLEDQTSNLLKAITANPDTMNAGIVAQLQEKNKEQALQMQQQGMQQYGQGAVARGTLGGGDQTAFNQNSLMNTINSVLSGNRGIDIQAASQNRQDELNAANASDSFLSNQMGRATQGYGAQLSGQNAQAGENFKGYQSQAAAQQAALQQVLSQYGMNSDAARFNEATRQFNAGNSLDIQKFLESQRQFNDNLGFNYAGMDQSGNNNLMSLIQSIINQGR